MTVHGRTLFLEIVMPFIWNCATKTLNQIATDVSEKSGPFTVTPRVTSCAASGYRATGARAPASACLSFATPAPVAGPA